MQTIEEKIKQRRLQMLVHSYIYYELNQSIVSDDTWSRWAFELAELQRMYPKESSSVEYADEFDDWDGSTGAFLIFPEAVKAVANRLLALRDRKRRTTNITPATKNIAPATKRSHGITRKLF